MRRRVERLRALGNREGVGGRMWGREGEVEARHAKGREWKRICAGRRAEVIVCMNSESDYYVLGTLAYDLDVVEVGFYSALTLCPV